MIVWGGQDDPQLIVEHWQHDEVRYQQLDGHWITNCTHCPILSHSDMDRQRNDRLGWMELGFAQTPHW